MTKPNLDEEKFEEESDDEITLTPETIERLANIGIETVLDYWARTHKK